MQNSSVTVFGGLICHNMVWLVDNQKLLCVSQLLCTFLLKCVNVCLEVCVFFIPVCMTVVLEGRDPQILIITYSFPPLGCTQMPRKFQLGRIRKNAERKRQKMRQSQGTNKMGRPSKKVGQNYC